MLLYLFILFLFTLFFVTTFHYKKIEYLNLPAKEYPLSFLYGGAFFILDVWDKYIKKGVTSKYDIRKKKKLSKIYFGVNPDKLLKLYKAKCITISFALIVIINTICFFTSLMDSHSNQKITSITRPEYENGSTLYDLNVEVDGTTSEIILEVSPKEITLEEALQYVESMRDKIELKMLGDNKESTTVSMPLNFISKYKKIKIEWNPINPDYIDYSGNILYENIPNDGIFTIVNANLTYAKHTVSIEFPIYILPKEESIKEKLESEIESNNDPFSNEINLPESINGTDASYYTIGSSSSNIFFFLG